MVWFFFGGFNVLDNGGLLAGWFGESFLEGMVEWHEHFLSLMA